MAAAFTVSGDTAGQDLTLEKEDTAPPVSLSHHGWENGNIAAAAQVDRYQFTAAAAATYFLQWDDADNSMGSNSASISVTAYRLSDGAPVFVSGTDGYFGSPAITVGAGETIYVRVEGRDGSTGTYDIRYYDPALAAPLNLSAQGNAAPACFISWDAFSGATGYKLYRSSTSSDSGYTLVYSGTGVSYTDTDVTVNTQYWYKVCAVTAAGDGGFSAAVSAVPPAEWTRITLSPTAWAEGNLSAAGQVDRYQFAAAAGVSYYLQWDDSAQGSGTYTCDVKVSAYRASDGDAVFTTVDSGYFSPQTIGVSTTDTIYVQVEGYSTLSTGTYAVRYYDPSGLPPQTAPQNVRAQGNPYPACYITWGSVSGATGYKLYRSTMSADSGYDPAPVYSGNNTSYTDTGVTANTQYWYKVCAVNGNGDGVLSAAASATTPASGVGTSLTYNSWEDGTLAAGQVHWYQFTASTAGTYAVQWDDSDHGGGKYGDVVVSAYRVSDETPVFFRLDVRYDNPPTISVGAGETIYLRVEGYSTSSSGTYAVRYYDPSGLPPQAAPSNVRAQGNPHPANFITWNSVGGATGYNLYRSVSENSGYGSPVSLGTVYSYTDTSVTAGVQYWYKVCAVNGNGDGDLSAAVSATPPAAGTGTLLASGTWEDGTISAAGEVDWYKFDAAANVSYRLQWDDRYNSAGGKTAYLYVSAYRAGNGTAIFSYSAGGYSSPPSFSVSSNDTIYVRVEGQGNNTGTYAVRYYQEP
jgi:fibronectin type 3 domain-containing protein